MFIVLVKHYLNADGQRFFKNEWFPLVKSIISQKNGYQSIDYKEIYPDCFFITIKFKDKETFFAWNANATHDHVINELDPYRSRDYWESSFTENENEIPSIKWDINKPRIIKS